MNKWEALGHHGEGELSPELFSAGTVKYKTFVQHPARRGLEALP